MPYYDYTCPRCGTFEAYGHFDESEKLCPKCESALAKREAVYQSQMVSGTVGRVEGDGPLMPPKDSTAEIQGELHEDMKKLGYDDDHLLEDMRGSRTWDDQGNMFVDTGKLPDKLETKSLKKARANKKK